MVELMCVCVTAAQCPREGCDGAQAFFYQVQIRSADEPMTTFYKVRFPGDWGNSFLTLASVRHVRRDGRRIDVLGFGLSILPDRFGRLFLDGQYQVFSNQGIFINYWE